jgi:hypothetical protein
MVKQAVSILKVVFYPEDGDSMFFWTTYRTTLCYDSEVHQWIFIAPKTSKLVSGQSLKARPWTRWSTLWFLRNSPFLDLLISHPLKTRRRWINSKFVPVLNWLSTMPWRRMGECIYIDLCFLDIGNRWRWVVSFTSRPLYHRGNRPRYPFDMRLDDPRTSLEAVEKRKIFLLDGIRTPVVQPVARRYIDWASPTPLQMS